MEAAERLTTPQKLPTRRRKKEKKRKKREKRKEHMTITLHVQEVGLTIQITLMGIKMYMYMHNAYDQTKFIRASVYQTVKKIIEECPEIM